MSAPASPSRRGFLGSAALLLSGAVGTLIGIPVVGALLSPLLRPAPKPEKGFAPVAALLDLQVGVPKRVEVRAADVDAWARSESTAVGAAWLVRQKDDSVTALSAICPHLGCGVNFDGRDKYQCPCHNSAFTGEGKCLGGPSPRGLDPLQVKVEKGQVLLRFTRFKLGSQKREEA